VFDGDEGGVRPERKICDRVPDLHGVRPPKATFVEK